jgi:hypothetical protein
VERTIDILTFIIVELDTGTNFPAVSMNSLLARLAPICDVIYTLLVYYAVCGGNSLPIFRKYLSVNLCTPFIYRNAWAVIGYEHTCYLYT